MTSNTTRIRALLLVFCLMTGLLFPSCVRSETASDSPSLLLSENGELTLSFRPADALLDAYAGKTFSLYEIKPGETAANARQGTPVAQGKLSKNTVLKLPIGDRDRIYSSFLPVAPDGTPLTDVPVVLSNPEQLAVITEEFPSSNRIKGLAAADEELSRTLYSAHTLVSLSASALTAGDGAVTASLSDVSVALDSAILAQTDRAVRSATNAGMQVSLSVLPDAELSLAAYAAMLDLLAERYVGGECGFVSAILIGKTQDRTEENALEETVDASRHADLLRYASLALLSRYQNGRVYLTVGGEMEAIERYLAQVKARTDALGCSFGVALAPDCEAVPTEDETAENMPARLSLFSLNESVKSLYSVIGRNTRFAVVGLSFPAADADLQAALYTYAYRASMNAKADMMIYSSQVGDENGLFSSDLTERAAAKAFRLADTDQNTEGERLAEELFPAAWKKQKSARPARFSFEGVANFGATEDRGTRLFDFEGDNAPVFSVAGNGQAPALIRSESLGAQVLATSLTDLQGPFGSGLRCTLENPDALKHAYVLAARLLPQSSPDFPAETATVTLLLDGTSSNGQAISYSASVSVSCNAWQSLTFQVRDFTERMDTSLPCTLTLLMRPAYTDEGEADGQMPDGEARHFALWLHSFDVREAAPDRTLPIALSLAVLGFALAVCAVLILRRLSGRRRTQTIRRHDQ